MKQLKYSDGGNGEPSEPILGKLEAISKIYKIKVPTRHGYFAYQIDVFTSLQFEIVTVC